MSKQDDAPLAFVSAADGDADGVHPLGPLTRELERVEAANTAFFEAYRTRNIDAMTSVWLPSAHARCIHPSSELVVGWIDIQTSWLDLFESLENVELDLEDVHVEVAGRIAWTNQLAYLTLETVDGEAVAATSICTNLFECWNGEWRLVLHHASSTLDDEDGDEEDDRGEPN